MTCHTTTAFLSGFGAHFVWDLLLLWLGWKTPRLVTKLRRAR